MRSSPERNKAFPDLWYRRALPPYYFAAALFLSFYISLHFPMKLTQILHRFYIEAVLEFTRRIYCFICNLTADAGTAFPEENGWGAEPSVR